MSAPDTNIEKQTDNHKAPLIGMGGVVILAGVLFAGFLALTFAQADDPTIEPAPGAVSTSN